MKKFALFMLSLLIIAGIGAAAAYFLGKQPETTYYPDGKIKTIANRMFFKKTGDFHVFNTNGVLSEKYNLIDGVKNGKAFLYGGIKPIEINYNNGTLVGDVIIDKAIVSPKLEELKVSIKQGNLLDITVKTKEASFIGEAKIVCPETDFIGKYQNYNFTRNADNFKSVLSCLSFSTITVESDEGLCKYSGEYIFPKFNADSKFVCDNKTEEETFGPIEKIKAEFDYIVEKQAFIIKTSDPLNPQNLVTSSFKGGEKIIESAINFALSDKKEQNQGKLLVDIIKNFTISDTDVMVGNKTISSVQGDFNIVSGFSNPYVISYYTNDLATSQIKITSDGIAVRLRYPLSKTPMLGVEIKVDDTIKAKYNKVVQDLMSELSKDINIKPETLNTIFAQWLNYAWQFSDVIKSVNGALWNNKGEKILAASATVKGKINFNTFLADMAQNVDIKIVEYKNSKPVYIAKGTMLNGFTLNNKPENFDKILETLQTAELDYTIKQIGIELEKAYGHVAKDWANGNYYPVDPLLYGAYTGYTSAYSKYNSNATSDQLAMIVANIRTLFANQGSYESLNNVNIISFGAIPNDMIQSAERGIIINNYQGNVTITTSKASSTDTSPKAFVIEFGGLPKETCVSLSSAYYGVDSGLVGVAAGVQKTANDHQVHSNIGAIANLLLLDESNGNSSEGLAYDTNTSLSPTNAIIACSGENNNNAVAFKFK